MAFLYGCAQLAVCVIHFFRKVFIFISPNSRRRSIFEQVNIESSSCLYSQIYGGTHFWQKFNNKKEVGQICPIWTAKSPTTSSNGFWGASHTMYYLIIVIILFSPSIQPRSESRSLLPRSRSRSPLSRSRSRSPLPRSGSRTSLAKFTSYINNDYDGDHVKTVSICRKSIDV